MKILLVEDDPRIAGLVVKGLEREHMATDHAPDAQTAQLMVEMNQYDLFIIDVGLPGSTDGFALCDILRRRGYDAPVLFLTARDSLADKLTGFDRGGDDYLVKPFAFAELVARIRALLKRANRPLQPERLKVGEWELDPKTHTFSIAGQEVELTSKEFQLLELLMQYPRYTLSKIQILEQVWGFAPDAVTNVVEVTIGRLRQKIEGFYRERGMHPGVVIQTVRGVGYRLADRS
ncbi:MULTISPECIES: response regulator transcription factor [Kyrpidia]|uniref:Transcriptional regulatory protein TcrA n=2 Tax=Kyrpidia spormannii TaxID=2055160 RepID=A0ACA8ZBI9_9BACL|nr:MULTISPECIES: response regulator transcription factor [Kyrpidia]MCL6577315.1 response regulator transcription factor [Kyrpidia sp.]CAB3394498.1 Transcriptional regulatory protein TcrA [Kyrpidia spormannii]CAB3395428.1 Transcriptional regulatory protein TcrA [Kyrpidia spormannii]